MKNIEEAVEHRVHQAILRGMDYTYAGNHTLTGEAASEAFNVLAGEWIKRRLDHGFEVGTMIGELNAVISTLMRVRRAMLGCGAEGDVGIDALPKWKAGQGNLTA